MIIQEDPCMYPSYRHPLFFVFAGIMGWSSPEGRAPLPAVAHITVYNSGFCITKQQVLSPFLYCPEHPTDASFQRTRCCCPVWQDCRVRIGAESFPRDESRKQPSSRYITGRARISAIRIETFSLYGNTVFSFPAGDSCTGCPVGHQYPFRCMTVPYQLDDPFPLHKHPANRLSPRYTCQTVSLYGSPRVQIPKVKSRPSICIVIPFRNITDLPEKSTVYIRRCINQRNSRMISEGPVCKQLSGEPASVQKIAFQQPKRAVSRKRQTSRITHIITIPPVIRKRFYVLEV